MIDIYTVLSKNSNLQFCILIMKSVNKSPSKYVSFYESHEHGSIAYAHDYNGEKTPVPHKKDWFSSPEKTTTRWGSLRYNFLGPAPV